MINGAKMWITSGTLADVAVVWATTGEGIRGFLVEKGAKGYVARDIKRKMSLRASVTSELFFDDVRVPDSARLPEAAGLAAPLSCLTQARYGIVWGALGEGGITLDQHAIRHRLNLESVITYEGTEMIHELAVGRELTGVAAFQPAGAGRSPQADPSIMRAWPRRSRSSASRSTTRASSTRSTPGA